MRTIVDFEIVDHGIENEQYFQGCGISYTSFSNVATGIGDNPAEAIDDCLEQIAVNGTDTEGMEERILADIGKRRMPRRPVVSRKSEECHYYVSIRWNELAATGETMTPNLYAKISPDGRVDQLLMPSDNGDLPEAPIGEGWYGVQWPTNPNFTGERMVREILTAGFPGRTKVGV